MAQNAIELQGIGHAFRVGGRQIVALANVSLSIAKGSLVAVVGPNGSGKSTLLRIVNGLIRPDAGQVLVDGTPVIEPDPQVGLVFQEPRLLPWRTVADNIALPLELAGIPPDQRLERTRPLLDRMGLTGFEGAYPWQLSGGLAQRSGICRALVMEPSVLLLDEPFSALDALTRDRLNLDLLDLWTRTGSTIVLVTHSIPEAVFLADRVIVLSARPGRVVADIPVTAARPRSASAIDGAAFSEAASAVRSALERGNAAAVGAAA